MIVLIESDVALSRPPVTDATIYASVEAAVSHDRLDVALRRATVEAMETAYLMALSHPRVVMVTAQRVTGIEEL